MRILVISDSHLTSLSSLSLEKYDAVIHCGDYGDSLEFLRKHAYFVRGNCDSIGEFSLKISLFGRKVYITHGTREKVKFGLDCLVYRALAEEVSICMFGHTHQAVCFQEEHVLFLNPGSYPNSYIEITEEAIFLFQNKTVKTFQFRW